MGHALMKEVLERDTIKNSCTCVWIRQERYINSSQSVQTSISPQLDKQMATFLEVATEAKMTKAQCRILTEVKKNS